MLVSPEHKINIPVRKILVVQLGDIGDVVWSIPALLSLKNAYRQASLCVLTRSPNGDLLLDDINISQVFQVGHQSIYDDLKLLKKLRQEKFDLAIDLRADDRGAFTLYFSGSPMRAALYYPGLSWRNRLFTHLVNPPPVQVKVLGAAEQSLKIIRGLGIQEVTTTPVIIVPEKMKNKMSQLLAAQEVEAQRGWVSINPFSRWSYKEWSMDKWRQLALFIRQQYAMPCIIIGSAEEKKRADELISACDFPIYNFAGKASLREMPGLLQMSSLHIGVDSAAPHIAAAVGTSTLTIYGPSDWRDWAPPGDKNNVVLPEMSCSPCYQKGCEGTGKSLCLENLAVDKVQEAVAKILDNSR